MNIVILLSAFWIGICLNHGLTNIANGLAEIAKALNEALQNKKQL